MSDEPNRKISYAEASKCVRNKGNYYSTMQKNEYHMPSKHSSICSLSFMRAARKGIVYIPKRFEVQFHLQCFNPPPRQILLQKLLPALEKELRVRVKPNIPRQRAISGLIVALKKRDANV